MMTIDEQIEFLRTIQKCKLATVIIPGIEICSHQLYGIWNPLTTEIDIVDFVNFDYRIAEYQEPEPAPKPESVFIPKFPELFTEKEWDSLTVAQQRACTELIELKQGGILEYWYDLGAEWLPSCNQTISAALAYKPARYDRYRIKPAPVFVPFETVHEFLRAKGDMMLKLKENQTTVNITGINLYASTTSEVIQYCNYWWTLQEIFEQCNFVKITETGFEYLPCGKKKNDNCNAFFKRN